VTGLAILHPANLLGKELTETIEHRAKQWREVRLLSTRDEEIGTLTDVGGAVGLVTRYEPESLQGISTVYYCGPAAANRPLFGDLPADAAGIVLSPDATEKDGVPVVAGVNTDAARAGTILVSPHPGVVLLAHLLHALRELEPVSAAATLIQPVSLFDNPGLEDLFNQTSNIVAMTGAKPSVIFGTQLAFNMIPATADPLSLTRTLRTVLGGKDFPITLQVVQGGIFHSVTASLYVRMPEKVTAATIRKAFLQHPWLESAEHPKRLGPIDAAAHEKVLFGTIQKDDLGGFWIWAVMDNLTRGGAINAIEIAEAVP
jgi:aspartate-semialdehyde dehydrogenase